MKLYSYPYQQEIYTNLPEEEPDLYVPDESFAVLNTERHFLIWVRDLQGLEATQDVRLLMLPSFLL